MLREKALRESNVFRFISENQRFRRPSRGTGCRELARIWFRIRERRSRIVDDQQGPDARSGFPVGPTANPGSGKEVSLGHRIQA